MRTFTESLAHTGILWLNVLMRTYIKNLTPGTRFIMVSGTVYVATRVYSEAGKTAVAYTVEGSHFRGETEFVRPSLTTCEVI